MPLPPVQLAHTQFPEGYVYDTKITTEHALPCSSGPQEVTITPHSEVLDIIIDLAWTLALIAI